MKRLLDWVQGVALALGGPGLFLLAFLDSSFLSFPEVVDLLIIWMVTRHENLWLYYAFMATAGSIAGCYALYHVALRGGEAFLRKRMHERHVDRTMAIFQKYGLAAVAIPSILPPPVPFKVFVLAAGVARVRRFDFILAVTIGRGVRYFGEALLAYWYGDRAAAFLSENAAVVSMVIAATVLLCVAIWMWSRRRSAEAAG